MSEVVDRKFYRLSDGRVGSVRIEVDDDQAGANPRDSDINPSMIFTWGTAYLSPDNVDTLPDALRSAVSEWTDSRSADAWRIVRYARMFHTDSILYIGAVSRNAYDGSLSFDGAPENGAHYDGIVVITREQYSKVYGPDTRAEDIDWSKVARREVEFYSDWATGEVFGWVAEIDGVDADSTWAYVGTDQLSYMYRCGTDSFDGDAVEIQEWEYDEARAAV